MRISIPPTLEDFKKIQRDPASRIGLHKVTVAAILAEVNPRTIWKGIRAGRIPAYGYRGTLRVRLQDVLPEYEPKVRGNYQECLETVSPNAQSEFDDA